MASPNAASLNDLRRRKQGTGITPVAPVACASARLDRLRELFARLDVACAAPGNNRRADRELNEVCDAICKLGEETITVPSPGLAGVAELAMAAQYWFRPPPHQGSAWDPTSAASRSVCALIAGVFDLCEGGFNG